MVVVLEQLGARVDPFIKKQATRRLESSSCTYCPQIEALSRVKRLQYFQALADPSIQTVTIQSVLDDWGIHISTTVVRMHRKAQQCAERQRDQQRAVGL